MQLSRDDPLCLRFLGSLIEELGAKMYPSVTRLSGRVGL